MPYPFTISLGGIPIALVPEQISGEYESVNRAVEFQTLENPEISLQVHCGGFPDLTNLPVAYETIQGWQLFYRNGRRLIKGRSAALDPYNLGDYAPDYRSGDLYLAAPPETPDLYRFPFSYPMGELFMMNLLGTGVGMLFHACGVIEGGKAYLFSGNSRAGKTTTARMWQGRAGVRVVNDDKVIVRKQDGKFMLYGTPWHGEGGMALPDSAPLARVFLLKHGQQNILNPLTPVQAASGLFGLYFIPLWDSAKIDFTLQFLDELCQAVPCQEYSFLPDSSAVEFVSNLND